MGIFHMDIPYSPDAFDQRAGRGLRKGNEAVQIYGNAVVERFYGIKDSTDIFSYSLNTHKENFREQILEADPNKRVYDDLVPDDKSLSYEQMQAALIGDMDQFQLVKLSDDLKFLQSQKRLHELNKANSFKAVEGVHQAFMFYNRRTVKAKSEHSKTQAGRSFSIVKYESHFSGGLCTFKRALSLLF